jgi:hypothetical protein
LLGQKGSVLAVSIGDDEGNAADALAIHSREAERDPEICVEDDKTGPRRP